MRYILILLLIASPVSWILAQGCSDAGFCTMGAMRPSQVYENAINFKLRSLEFSYYSGNSTLSPVIRSATMDFTFGITEKTNVQFKLPYQWVSGNLGSTQGIADLSLTLTSNLKSNEKYTLNGSVGFKIPTGNSDLDETVVGRHLTTGLTSADLPMYYQISLGTFDLVFGGAYITRKWMFASGFQIPLIQNNENDFRYSDWQNYPDIPNYLLNHDLANNLKRGVDFMVRAERAFHFSNFDIRLGILPIFRITQDEILDVDPDSPTFNERIKLDGTTGLALTGLLNVAYHFNTKYSLKMLYGQKILVRDVNPDGLTRDNVLSLSYVINF